jgi:UDP-N-acetyl-D-mannosaminuronic acid dehydrogenase
MKIKNDIKRFCLSEKASIMEAMKVINEAEERTSFLVDSRMRLVRVITDGDIRRALLKGHKLEDPVKDIHDRKPFVIKEGQNLREARKYLSKRIAVIPIIDNKNQVKGLIRLHDVEPFLNIKSRKILVLGMGYVGLTLAAILADEGFAVYGFDINKSLIDLLKKKKTPFYEKGIDNYLKKHVNNNLSLVTSLKNFNADILIITVQTPIDEKTKAPNTQSIREATKSIGRILKKNDLVILRSTVPVGLTRKTALPILEKESGLKAGRDFYIAYCPERTVEGNALEELRKNPQIIGGYDPRSTELASRLFNEITHTIIDVGSLEAAEMCKLLDNTYRDTIFAYSNQMALFCEKAGLNLHDLIEKVNLLYHRNIIPKPSPGVGGACLSKDPYILIHNFREYGLDCPLIQDVRKINELAPRSIYERSIKIMSGVGKDLKRCKIFIIGFAFKGEPETSDLRESTTLWLLDELKRNKVENIWGYDPIIESRELEKLGVIPCSLEEGFQDADAVYVMNNHRSYSEMNIFELLDTTNQPALFFDSWQIFVPSDIRNIPGIIYGGIGVG